MTYKLVYVCANNKGRSVALAAYTKQFLEKQGIEEVVVESGGIMLDMIESLRKRQIDKASQNTYRILKDEGIDVSNHRVQYVGEIIEGSNLILATDEMTLVRTRLEFPEYKHRSFLAKQYAGFSRNTEIFGPYAESRKLRIGDWSEGDLYRDMLRETKIVAKRVVEELIS